MVATTAIQPISCRVREELQINSLRIKAAVSAARLWERVLTERDHQQLGGDLEKAWREHGTAGMWAKLRGVSVERAVVDVARELNFLDDQTRRWLLRELGEIHDDPEEAIAMAVTSVALVLVERPRTAYWQGQTIPVDWDRYSAPWDYLWELCLHAKAGQSIDHTTFPTSSDVAFVTKQKSRLLAWRHFPRDLGMLIKPVGRHTQTLDLAPAQIKLFEVAWNETLKEHTA